MGRADPGWVGVGAPGDQDDLEIETAGTVLLRSEICMCFTPSLVYELTCASHSTQAEGVADSIAVTDSSIKSHHRSECRLQ